MLTSSTAPVVVGVNGSPASRAAVRAAAQQALQYGCGLRIVHAFNWLPAMPAADPDEPDGTPESVMAQAVAVATDAAAGVTVDTRMLEGPPAAVLLRQSRTARLIVVGAGSLSASACPPVDACAVQLAGRAACSVLVTPAASPIADGPVLVGVDRASGCTAVLDFALDAATRRGIEVIAIRVCDPATTADQLAEQQRWLQAAVAPAGRRLGVAVRSSVRRGEPAELLRREAAGAGLLVLGARGDRPYGGLPGSVVQSLLHCGPAPVVVVRRQLAIGIPAARRPQRAPRPAPSAGPPSAASTPARRPLPSSR